LNLKKRKNFPVENWRSEVFAFIRQIEPDAKVWNPPAEIKQIKELLADYVYKKIYAQ
jgi:hypothetical protein